MGKLRNLGLATVLATAMAGSLGTAQGAPITLFNTGVDDSGAVRGNTQPETHYTVISAPGAIPAIRAADSSNGYPIPPWLGDNSTSAWIGPVGTILNGDVGIYDYRITFDLTGLVPGTASITGQWTADDTGTDILINGVSTGQTTANAFYSFTAFSIGSGFVNGLNTLDFLVYNSGGPTGLRVEIAGTADPVGVPEPASMALLAAGLLGLGLVRRKRG